MNIKALKNQIDAMPDDALVLVGDPFEVID